MTSHLSLISEKATVEKVYYEGHFKMYVLYVPPGNATYVSCYRTQWWCIGNAELINGVWTYGPQSEGLGPRGNFYIHPTWTFRHTPPPPLP